MAQTREQMTGAHKAAMLIMSLEDDQAARLLRQMSEQTLTKLRAATADLDPSRITDAHKREALRGFFVRRSKGGFVLGRPEERFRQLVADTRDDETVKRLFHEEDNEPLSLQEMDPQQAIQVAPEEQIARLLELESPRCGAVLLRQLDGSRTGRIVNMIQDEEKREAIVERLIGAEPPVQEVVDCVVGAFHAKLIAMGPENEMASTERRARELAGMIKSLDHASQDRVLAQLAERDVELAEAVEREMFSFSDLPKVSQRSMQELLRNVEVPTIALALKGAADDIEQHFADNLSTRALERVREEREMAGRVAMTEVETAREDLMKIARRMYREGDLVVETGEEEYVE